MLSIWGFVLDPKLNWELNTEVKVTYVSLQEALHKKMGSLAEDGFLDVHSHVVFNPKVRFYCAIR